MQNEIELPYQSKTFGCGKLRFAQHPVAFHLENGKLPASLPPNVGAHCRLIDGVPINKKNPLNENKVQNRLTSTNE